MGDGKRPCTWVTSCAMFTASISSAYSSWISTDAEAAAFGDHAVVRWRRAEAERGEGRKPGARGLETEVKAAEMGAAAVTRRSGQAGGGAIAMAASLRSCCVLVCVGCSGVFGRREREGSFFQDKGSGDWVTKPDPLQSADADFPLQSP